ncbi:hypothetical protein [Actinomadura rifamycini]|uniref:hypothetical protein n=1 Tax=Actinomadura rifamycini TaxID=31962 RepID=UPI0012F8AB64|nr:hypothetical protein [Actinomadura rifamycini]
MSMPPTTIAITVTAIGRRRTRRDCGGRFLLTAAAGQVMDAWLRTAFSGICRMGTPP